MLKVFSRVLFGTAIVLLATAFYMLPRTSAATCTESPCNVAFQVNVKESLAVNITTPTTWASGDVGDFLRNTVTVGVTSNNATGFTATMHASNSALTNSSKSTATLPTLDSSTVKSSFQPNHWGYSLDTTGDVAGANCSGYTVSGSTCTYNSKAYNETIAGNNDSYYHAVPTSSAPATILTGTGISSGTRNVFFGAKANASQASGTYTGTIIISVITGTINDGHQTPQSDPSSPVTPSDDTANDNTATYVSSRGSTNGATVYTTTSSTASSATTSTQVSDGNNTSSYALPQGVTTSSTSNNVEGNSVAPAILAGVALTAATAGIIVLVADKRRKDDEEEEQ